MRANYHTHCDLDDGKASPAAMAAAAAAAGYRILGFSSHAPMAIRTDWQLPPERLGPYVAEVRRLGSEWAGKGLEILLGLEIDWKDGDCSPAEPRWDGLGLDYRIGSVHYVSVDGAESFTVDEPDEDFSLHLAERGGDARAVWRSYYRAVSEMIMAGGFDIVGHFDLVRKNNKGGLYFDEEDPLYLSAAIGAARLLKGRDLVVEVNVGGMARGKTSTPYPSLPVMKELRSLGVPITFSADAHAVAHLGACLDAARELAAAAGYASVAVLSGGSWREVGLADT